jgi:enoyl-CoA hydratase
MLCGSAHHGSGSRAYRRDGNSCRRAVSIARFRDCALRRSAPEFTLSGATYATDEALRRGWVDELAEPSDLMDDAMAVAKELALLSPGAFAQTKMQIRQPVVERVQKSGKVTDEAVTEIWAAPATLAYIRDYVTRTLGKS